MIECEVMGLGARPYDYKGRQGTSYKVSVSLGDYPSERAKGIIGEGLKLAEYKCPEKIFNGLHLGDVVALELENNNGDTRIKSAYFKNADGSFLPVG